MRLVAGGQEGLFSQLLCQRERLLGVMAGRLNADQVAPVVPRFEAVAVGRLATKAAGEESLGMQETVELWMRLLPTPFPSRILCGVVRVEREIVSI